MTAERHRDTCHVCFFTVGIDELPVKQQRSMRAVARVLAKHGRFSVFEATANQRIARTMGRIVRAKWFELTDLGYPWTGVKLTDAGRAALEQETAP